MIDPKVTVVVPAYNNETVIRECLDSIVGQTLKEIEVIVVDDESTDKTFDIAKEYEAADERVTAHRQKHSNAGEARNYGLSVAKGEYLVFWDSDDFFDVTALEKLYSKAVAQNADVCICDADKFDSYARRFFPKDSYLRKDLIPEKEVFNRRDFKDHYLILTANHPWNKMFKRQFIFDKGIRFQSVSKANDVFFVIMALSLAERVTVVNERLIHYRTNYQGSITRTGSTSPMYVFDAYESVKDALEKAGVYSELSRDIVSKAFSSYVFALGNQCEVNNIEHFRKVFDYIRDEAFVKLDCVSELRELIYDDEKREIYDRIFNGSYEDYLFYYIKNKNLRLEKMNKKLKTSNDKVEAYEKSILYKIWKRF